MEKIYPNTTDIKEPFVLTDEETKAIKKGLVLAIEKDIAHPQDRALYALTATDAEPERQFEIRCNLNAVMSLEPQVIAVGKELREEVEEAFEDKDTAEMLEAKIAWPDMVDKSIYTKRFIEAKDGEIITPVFEKPVIIVADETPLEESDPFGELDPIEK